MGVLGRSFGRYRPYVIVVVAVLLIVVVPGRHHSRPDGGWVSGVVTGGPETTTTQPLATIGTVAAGGAPAANTPVQVTAPAPRSAQAATTRTTTAAAPSKAAAAAASSVTTAGSGIGSPAAHAAPDCDPNTKKLEIEFVWAPPCVVPWTNGTDNGGATMMGVTADTINVVIFNPSGAASTTSDADLLAQVQKAGVAFERFYRMWGRKVKYTVFHATGNDEVSQRADAVKIASMKPFLALNVFTDYSVLVTELASRHILLITSFDAAKHTTALAPYIWGYVLHPDEIVQLNAAAYAGNRLLGRNARWAGQPEYQAMPRKFGFVYADTWDPNVFNDEFAKYGGKPADQISYPFGAVNAPSYAERARTIIARLKDQGVTTVITGVDLVFLTPLTKEATSQQWFPEWVTTGFAGQDLDLFGRVFDQLQWRHAFGVGALTPGSSFGTPAARFYKWYWGTAPAGQEADWVWPMYSGIHGAGPKLTPETFRDGVFAVPPAGGAATGGVISPEVSYGRWGFFPFDDYNAYDDFTEIWWDATGRGRDNAAGTEGVGVYRYVDGGARHRPQQWPKTEPKAFDPNGVAPYYEGTVPPGDRVPDYPCPACPGGG